MEHLQRFLATLEEDRFGDLNLQPVRRQPAERKRVDDHLIEPGALELNRRDIDGDPDVIGPRRCLSAGFAHGPRADRNDHPGVFGNGDKLERRNQPTRRVIPSQQGFKRSDAL